MQNVPHMNLVDVNFQNLLQDGAKSHVMCAIHIEGHERFTMPSDKIDRRLEGRIKKESHAKDRSDVAYLEQGAMRIRRRRMWQVVLKRRGHADQGSRIHRWKDRWQMRWQQDWFGQFRFAHDRPPDGPQNMLAPPERQGRCRRENERKR